MLPRSALCASSGKTSRCDCRLSGLTNAYSKKWDNLKAALAIHFAWYNFFRVRHILRVAPATEVEISGHLWTVEELIA